MKRPGSHAGPTTNRDHPRPIDLLSISAAGVLLALALRPFQPTPFIDDWVYAFPVQQLVETGALRIPDASMPGFCSLPIRNGLVSSVWLFLHHSWAVDVGVMDCPATGYVLPRSGIGGSRRNALIGSSIVAVFPACFGLASSFMTDVPFLAAETWSTLVFVRAVDRRSDRLVWIASLIACAAIGIRMVGVVIPCAMLAVLILHAGEWGRRPRLLIAPLLCLVCAAIVLALVSAFAFVSADVSYLPGAQALRMSNLPVAFRILTSTLPGVFAEAAVEAGIALIPAALGLPPLTRRRLVVAVGAAIGMALLVEPFTDWIPFGEHNFWLIGEPWGTPGLVPGWTPRFQFPPALGFLTRVVAYTVLAALLVSGRAWGAREAEWFAVWSIAGLGFISAMLWLFNDDRYGLVYLPIVVAFLLSRTPRIRLLPALAGLAVFGLVCVVSTHDHKFYNHALWSTVARLQAQGIPAAEIHGGYTVNAWLQYVHPERAHREPDGRITIPFFNDEPEVEYTISNSPLPETSIVDVVPYPGWYRSGNLYVLRRLD